MSGESAYHPRVQPDHVGDGLPAPSDPSRDGAEPEGPSADARPAPPDAEPAGYFENLQTVEPEILWDDQGRRPKLETEADWIAAGELAFDAPVGIGNGRGVPTKSDELDVRDREWYRANAIPLTPEGEMPWLRYVVRTRGKVEVGVSKEGRLTFNGRPVAEADLEVLLAEVKKVNKDTPILVRADEVSQFGVVTRVWDTCRKLGLNKVVMQTRK